jgi:WD40 repeat protein
MPDQPAPAAANPASAAVQPAPAAAPAPTPPAPVADPTQIRLLKELKHDRPLFSCRIDPQGKFVFAGAHDSLVERWDAASDKKDAFTGHQSWVRGMAFQPAGDLLCTGDYAGRVNAWRYAAEPVQSPIYSIAAHKGWVRAMAISPDGATMATVGNDNIVRLWNAGDGKPLRELIGHESHVYNVAFHPGGHLVSADLKGVIKDWDLATGAAVRQFDASLLWKYDSTFRADIGGARGFAISPDGQWVAAAGITDVTNAFAGIGHAVIALFDWNTGERKQVLRPKEDFKGVAWSVAFHPAGFIVAAAGGGGGGALWFFKPDAPQPFHAFKLPAVARDMALHPNGLHVAVAHYDKTLRLYDMSPKPAA